MKLIEISGLGTKRISALNSAGILSCTDLLSVFPYKYYDFSEISSYEKSSDETNYYSCKIISEPKCIHIRGLSYVIAKAECKKSGTIFSAVWYNQSFMKNVIKENLDYFLFGKPNKKGQLVVQFYKEISVVKNSFLIPVYKSFAGLGSKILHNSIDVILKEEAINSKFDNISKISLKQAFEDIHNPKNIESIQKAKDRIDFEDMILIASLQNELDHTKTRKKRKYRKDLMKEFVKICPFKLTSDQNNAIDNICDDMMDDYPMNRLLMGDVGSGKTIVAFASCYMAIKSSFQAVIVAPTEILARQHYESAKMLFEGQNIRIALLNSKLKITERKTLLKKISNNEIDLIIGTHAVFSNDVIYSNLALVVTDEQHRFGVEQRSKLDKKSNLPDTLIMSATPIPRSISLIFFGNLKVSKLFSRPFGDSKIKTNIVPYAKYADMLNFIAEEIKTRNAKCFIIVPRIEEGDLSELDSIESIKKSLDENLYFSDKFQILYGKQDEETKNNVINNFKCGKFPVLLSTTVVEVGVDVPDANIIVIHNAERFGLATLHQLRGRVGRDGKQGFCFCLSSSNSDTAHKRLQLLKNNNDGFILAEEDYKMRGAGTLFGTKQHGICEILSVNNFSLDNFEKVKIIFDGFSSNEKETIKIEAQQKFGEIFSKIVLN